MLIPNVSSHTVFWRHFAESQLTQSGFAAARDRRSRKFNMIQSACNQFFWGLGKEDKVQEARAHLWLSLSLLTRDSHQQKDPSDAD